MIDYSVKCSELSENALLCLCTDLQPSRLSENPEPSPLQAAGERVVQCHQAGSIRVAVGI